MKQIKKDLMDLAVQYDKTGGASKAIERVADPIIAMQIAQEDSALFTRRYTQWAADVTFSSVEVDA